MSRAAAIRSAVRQAFNNRDLKLDHVRLIVSGAEVPEGHVAAFLLDPGVLAMVPVEFDRRGQLVEVVENGPRRGVGHKLAAPKSSIPKLPPRTTPRRV